MSANSSSGEVITSNYFTLDEIRGISSSIYAGTKLSAHLNMARNALISDAKTFKIPKRVLYLTIHVNHVNQNFNKKNYSICVVAYGKVIVNDTPTNMEVGRYQFLICRKYGLVLNNMISPHLNHVVEYNKNPKLFHEWATILEWDSDRPFEKLNSKKSTMKVKDRLCTWQFNIRDLRKKLGDNKQYINVFRCIRMSSSECIFSAICMYENGSVYTSCSVVAYFTLYDILYTTLI